MEQKEKDVKLVVDREVRLVDDDSKLELLDKGYTEQEILEKSSKAAALIVADFANHQQALDPPERTDDWIALYQQMSWIYTGIFTIATTIAGLGLQLWQKDKATGKLTEIINHPVLDLIRKPNPDESGFELIEGLLIYLETTGMGYFEVVKERVGSISKPIELYNLRPSRVTPVPAKDGSGINHWIYQVKKRSKKIKFDKDDIVPFKYFNPLKEWLGQSPLEAALDDIILDKQMIQWNIDFFKHGGAVEGVLETEQILTFRDMETLTSMWKDFVAGNGRTTPVLTKGLVYHPLGANPKDVEFIIGRKTNSIALLGALGVPPIKVGILENAKYDNYKLQEEAFHRGTVLPKLRKLESSYNCSLLPMFADLVSTDTTEFFLKYDADHLLAEDEDRLTRRMKIQISHGIRSPNEARKLLGLDPYPEGETFFIDQRLIPVSEVGLEANLERQEDEVVKSINTVSIDIQESMEEMKEDMIEEVMDRVREREET